MTAAQQLAAALKQLFCRHRNGLVFVRNLYGDEIIEHGMNRSVWRCKRCGADVWMPELNREQK